MGLPKRQGRALLPELREHRRARRCSRDTVYEAIKALEFANILTWVNRITRISVRSRDLFGQWATRWQIIRTSNAYLFRDPLPCHEGRPSLRSLSRKIPLEPLIQTFPLLTALHRRPNPKP